MSFKVYWVNLPHMTKRASHMRTLLSNCPYDHEHIEAVSPSTMPPYIDGNREYPLRPTEYACTLSHMKALQACLQDEHEYAIIVEDDIANIERIDFDHIVKSAPDNWECLQLQTNNLRITLDLYNNHFLKRGTLWMEWDPNHWSTLVYVIHKERVRDKILQMTTDFTKFPIRPVADIFVYSSFLTYTTTKPLTTSLDEDSSIHPEHLAMHSMNTRISNNIMNEQSKK